MIDVQHIKIGLIAKVLTVASPIGMKQLSILLKPWIMLGKYNVTLTYNTRIGLACHTESFTTRKKQIEFFDGLTQEWFEAELGK